FKMEKDLSPVKSFFETIKERISNPFFGTLILVLIGRNWELIYSLFNFESSDKRLDRISIINTYFEDKSFVGELAYNLLLTIGLMLLGYTLIVLTRTLSIWIEYNVMPLITKKVISSEVVPSKQFKDTAKERDDYFDRYENERKRLREIIDDYDTLRENFQKTSETFNKLSEEHEKLTQKNIDLEGRISELNERIKEINFKNSEYKTKNNELNKKVNQLKDESFVILNDIDRYKI